MSRTRTLALLGVVVVLAASGGAARAQDAAPASPVAPPPGAVIVEAGTPVPVPLEGVAERLRAELPAVPVQVGPALPSNGPAAATVTLGLTADGQMHVVYRDAAGREASRIVADTHDPQAVAAAIAMVVANLHRSQVDLALAAIGPALLAVPAVPAPPPAAPAPPPAVPAPPAPPVVPNRPVAPAPPAAPARASARAVRVVTPAPSRLSFSLAPIMDFLPGQPIYGVELSAELVVQGPYRAEVSLGTTVPMSMFEYRPSDLSTIDGTYSQTTGAVRLRRLLPLGSHVVLGAAVGLGLVISVHEDLISWDENGQADPWGGRSDLDALLTAGASLDVRVIGQTIFWTTHLDVMLTTGGDSTFRPFGPGTFAQASTGVRVAL